MNDIKRDAAEIKACMREVESLTDELLIAVSKLRIKLLQARANPGVTPHEGQAALLRLQQADRAILTGSNNLFRVHDELSEIAVRMDAEHPTPASGLLVEAAFQPETETAL